MWLIRNHGMNKRKDQTHNSSLMHNLQVKSRNEIKEKYKTKIRTYWPNENLFPNKWNA